MAIAQSVEQFLDRRGVSYDLATHERTGSSAATARAGAISETSLAKGVLVKRKNGYVLAIVPASCRVQLNALASAVGQPVSLATEEEVAEVFNDCAPGSVPPVGAAYGLASVLDDHLEGLNDIYFEGGDHCTLVHLRKTEFHRLMVGVPHFRIGEELH
ncbi:MAG: YbaK/EbsC family protein [Pseudomonadota bacterium]